MIRIGAVVFGYFLGCINFAYLIGRFKEHIDIREYGSKNSGTTNAIRVLGWRLGGLTFIGDMLKAIVGYLLMYQWTGGSVTLAVYTGAGVIIGHNWPVFLKFKGGKGIAATLGVMMAYDYRAGLLVMLMMFIIIVTTRYVSVASLLLAVLMPIFFYVFKGWNIEIIGLGVGLGLLAIFQHRSNIKRLIQGNENKIGRKRE